MCVRAADRVRSALLRGATRRTPSTRAASESLDDVIGEVDRYGCSLVEVTGGEPLLQEEVYPLMQRSLDSGKTVLLETGGHRSTARVPADVVTILDVKCPGSGEVATQRLGEPANGCVRTTRSSSSSRIAPTTSSRAT